MVAYTDTLSLKAFAIAKTQKVSLIRKKTNKQKNLHDPDNQDGVIIHLEPDILECEVKWALGSITMNKARVMEFQWSYFKS